MEITRESDGHSLPRDRTGRDKSGHGKRLNQRGRLTPWRADRKGQVRTRKETDRQGSSPTGDYKGNKSEHGKIPTERGALTNWRPHQEGQFRTRKGTDQTRGTHILETTTGRTSQDTGRNRPSEGHPRAGGRIGRDKSGHGKKSAERRALTSWRPHREGQIRMRKETERARLTFWDRIEGDKSGHGESETYRARGAHFLETASRGTSQEKPGRAKGAHFLETASRGTSQDTERNRSSEGHSQTGDRIGRGESGHGKKPAKRGALTTWRPDREEQVRTWPGEETDQGSDTHELDTASGRTSQDA